MSDLLKTLDSFKEKVSAAATAAGVNLPTEVATAIAKLEEESKIIVQKLDQIKAEEEAKKKAEAQAEAEKEAEADAEFVKWLNDNDFAAFYGKGGKIACSLSASLKNDAEEQASEQFGLLQAQAEGCSFDLQKFKSTLFNYQYNETNRYALIVHLNIKGGVKLQKFGGPEVGTYFK